MSDISSTPEEIYQFVKAFQPNAASLPPTLPDDAVVEVNGTEVSDS